MGVEDMGTEDKDNDWRKECDLRQIPNFQLGFFATGYYQNKCAICHELFIGDKRAMHCLECAIDIAESK